MVSKGLWKKAWYMLQIFCLPWTTGYRTTLEDKVQRRHSLVQIEGEKFCHNNHQGRLALLNSGMLLDGFSSLCHNERSTVRQEREKPQSTAPNQERMMSNSNTISSGAQVELWLSGLSARSGTREVPGSSPVSSYSCEDNFSQLNPQVLRGLSITSGSKPRSKAQQKQKNTISASN